MDQTPLVRPSESGGNVDSQAQEPPRFHRLAEEALKRFPAEILEQQRGPAAFAHEVKRSRSPSCVKLVFQPALVRKAIERQRRQTLTDYCGPIRMKPVNEIATADVLAVLKPLWARAPETASRLRGRIESVLDGARALGHIPEDKANPARWKGHLDHLLAPPKKLGVRGHHKAMPYDQLPEFVKRLRASDNMAALALEFLVLTATRTSETINATWQEFDLQAAVWSIPPGRMKTNDAFSVPLSERAVAILADAQRMARKESTAASFVFFGVIPKRPLSNMALSMLCAGRTRQRPYMALERASGRGRARSVTSSLKLRKVVSATASEMLCRGPTTDQTSWTGGGL
jgi:integrase